MASAQFSRPTMGGRRTSRWTGVERDWEGERPKAERGVLTGWLHRTRCMTLTAVAYRRSSTICVRAAAVLSYLQPNIIRIYFFFFLIFSSFQLNWWCGLIVGLHFHRLCVCVCDSFEFVNEKSVCVCQCDWLRRSSVHRWLAVSH